MVSLARAAQSIGRPIKHLPGIKLHGKVSRVGEYDVWVETTDGDTVPCEPENMEWVSVLPEHIKDGIRYGEEKFEDENGDEYTDLRYAMELRIAEEPGDEYLESLRIVYGPADQNGGYNKVHYLLNVKMRRVYVMHPDANPIGALEIEELLGWAER